MENEIPLWECCEIDGQKYPFSYRYKVADGLKYFIAPFCAPCPVEISQVWNLYVPMNYSETPICNGAFIFLLVIGIVFLILYGIVIWKRLGRKDISLLIAGSIEVFSVYQVIGY